VVHRDIKPSNIIIEDETARAVVTDFGIAKVSETQGLTVTGATVGTPSYMSPEQCAAKELTGASDQYSLGVVAYEMLSGKLPFVAESVMAVMYAHFNEPPPAVTLARADCPPALAEAVMRMLEKDPAHRFPSMEAATAAAGAAPLAPDDPVRTQMITLAAKGESMQLLERFSTPVSQPSAFGRGAGASGSRPSIATLLIVPARVTVAAGDAVQLRATAKSRAGQALGSRPVSWASTNTDVARVVNGLVTAVAPGVVTITASSENTSATAVITVVAARRPARRLALIGGGVALAAVVIALLVFRPFGGEPHAALGAADSQVVSGRGADTQPVVTVPTPSLPAESSAAHPGPDTQPRPLRRPSPTAIVRDSSESTVATALASARSARAMAVDAGAGAAELAAGDTEVQRAADLRRAGHRAEAFGHLRTAATRFATAESTAAAARLAAQRALPPRDTTPKPPPFVPPPAQPAPDPTPEIRAAIAAYAQALEKQDLNALKTIFPGIPRRDSDQWQDFFNNARNVRATLQPTRITPSGGEAEVIVSGSITYQSSNPPGHPTLPYNFHAHLVRQAGGWVIALIERN
jgi:hypothetical protein